jgi:3-phenylpropionate/trans-cinnamate dioxygenase ferredoxin subunit
MAEPMSVGPSSDVPEGEMRSFQIGGEDVAVANVGGSLYAFGDTCTHKQCSLSDGDLEDNTVTCPCHGSQFDVTTGEVRNPPATEPVDTYEVDVSNGELRISI